VYVLEEAKSNASVELVPGYRDAENSADLALNPPLFQKIHYLTFALQPFPAYMAAARVIGRTIKKVSRSVSVVAFLSEDDGH
jgi:hypothetical protein